MQEQGHPADAQVLHELLRRVLPLPRPMQGHLQHVQLGLHLHQLAAVTKMMVYKCSSIDCFNMVYRVTLTVERLGLVDSYSQCLITLLC